MYVDPGEQRVHAVGAVVGVESASVAVARVELSHGAGEAERVVGWLFQNAPSSESWFNELLVSVTNRVIVERFPGLAVTAVDVQYVARVVVAVWALVEAAGLPVVERDLVQVAGDAVEQAQAKYRRRVGWLW